MGSQVRIAAVVLLAIVFLVSLLPVDYEKQSRESIGASPNRQFPLGTDDLGRDRLARLIYGTRISLLMAPCAALVTLLIAAAIGLTAGFVGGVWDSFAMRLTDLFLSLPWLFLFIIVRSLLPLNTTPLVSLLITFLLMGVLGWAPAARVIRSAVRQFRDADFVLNARASGVPEIRIWIAYLIPRLRGILLTQFFLSIPIFILGEASLGILGLGVAEPTPSWGNLLRELTTAPPLNQYWIFTPVILLIAVMTTFQLLLPKRN
jgi:ABC-type dipeptide/oligopeptide/nickel transport system permease subunit